MSRPFFIDAQMEDIYLEFLAEGMTEKEAEEAMLQRMGEIPFDEERQHSGYDRYYPLPHPSEHWSYQTDRER